MGKVLLRAEQWLMGYRIGALYTENIGSLFGYRIVNMMNKILSLYVVWLYLESDIERKIEQLIKTNRNMATIETVYLGSLRTEATHVQSGTKLVTDAPVDNHGKGESFSPTDLVATALGSCMMTLMGIAGQTHDIDVDGTRLSITKVMAADPRRIGEIKIDVRFPKNYEPKQRKILENAALTCPVSKTLGADCKQTINFIYAE